MTLSHYFLLIFHPTDWAVLTNKQVPIFHLKCQRICLARIPFIVTIATIAALHWFKRLCNGRSTEFTLHKANHCFCNFQRSVCRTKICWLIMLKWKWPPHIIQCKFKASNQPHLKLRCEVRFPSFYLSDYTYIHKARSSVRVSSYM